MRGTAHAFPVWGGERQVPGGVPSPAPRGRGALWRATGRFPQAKISWKSSSAVPWAMMQSGILSAFLRFFFCLHPQHLQHFAHCLCRAPERRQFLVGEGKLKDAFDPPASKNDGNATVDILDAVLAVEVGGGGKEPLPVKEDGVRHLHDGRGRGIEGAAGFEKAHDLRPALNRAL